MGPLYCRVRPERSLHVYLISAAVVMLLCHLAAGYPANWAYDYLDLPSTGCIGHPDTGHARHANPVAAAITFALKNSAGKAVQTICPKAIYTLTVTLAGSDRGFAFITTDAGTLSLGEKPAGCNGARFAAVVQQHAFIQNLTVACNEVTAEGKLTIKTTYATGPGGTYQQGEVTFRVGTACYQTKCAASSPPPSASPSPAASPSPRTSPAPKPPANVCQTLPAVKGMKWPAACRGKHTCQAACKAGYRGSVRARCTRLAGWTVTGSCRPVAIHSPSPSPLPAPSQAWKHWGLNLENTRWAANETAITAANAGRLGKAWAFTTGGDVSATPTVVDGRVYVPDWAGYMYCLDAVTGALIWKKAIIEYVLAVDPNPYPSSYTNSSIISRTSPAISGNTMVFGVMKKGGGFPYLIAASIKDGSLIWGFRTDPHPAALMTQSPTIHNGFIYAGISSLEEIQADDPTYPCCTFIGNMLKVDLTNGAVLWRTYMAPENNNKTGGFSGNSIWGSSPSLNLELNHVYIATGNNYGIPKDLQDCIQAIGNLSLDNMAQQLQCEKDYGAGNYHNCMLALDMDTGAVKWVKQLGGPDAWTAACLFKNNPAACPDINSPDYDFAQAPMLVTTCKTVDRKTCKKRVVAGQKSGWLWSLIPETGEVDWSVQVGPGGTVGGLQWGSAADDSRIYVTNNNYNAETIDLTKMNAVSNVLGSTRAPTSTQGGLTAAVDAWSGTILWTFANPTMHWATSAPARNAHSQAPVTVANDVVYYASMDAKGTLFYLEASTGKLLGSFATGATCGCGPSVVDGQVFVGNGYLNFNLGQAGNKLYALKVQ